MNDADVLRDAASVIHDLDLDSEGRVNKGLVAELGALADGIEQRAVKADEPVPRTAGLFTRQEALNARNTATSILVDELGLGERDADLLALASALAAKLIDQPHVTLDEMILERYDESPAKVRAWWTAWA